MEFSPLNDKDKCLLMTVIIHYVSLKNRVKKEKGEKRAVSLAITGLREFC